MTWPQNLDYHVIKSDDQNLSMKYDRDPPHQHPHIWLNPILVGLLHPNCMSLTRENMHTVFQPKL